MSDGETVRDSGPPDRGEAAPLWARAAELFDAWRGGRADAMDGLVRLVTPALWHVVRAYGLGRDEAEDVIQTTWLALVRTGEGVHDARTVLAWLSTTARRESWRVVKATGRQSPTDDEALERLGDSVESAESAAERNVEGDRLWRAVESLSERCRRLLRVIAFSDRPDYVQLSTELQMPIGSIGPTRGRCLDKLRELLTTGEAR
ncbi:RNA polymerase sigma factor [Protaetiibacter mangrovi]|uniref:Sigma-70 family RNA polymerase sigma factor n=1 Tax=Protaetiibacter mangrovi TaxID=2970926 RepID=A0ABT1ZGA7_9MICO|nr:sigma-70 family RNA polymerase sigma factor [Protaetiibacter mangrovi]MCS0499715.1 sigma-70 family RNA polymerase sigma factor [Protaetiibacter mangrovi]TPX02835.1 sigma-70 family RNA polymerase sigma factor [Schumannella luteola]